MPNKEYRAKPEVLARRNWVTKQWNIKNLESVLLTHARRRAKHLGIECSITKEDIVIPKFCPVLGVELRYSLGHVSANSPSLDRLDPNKGYTKDNIAVISFRANRIKDNASVEELFKVAEWLKCQIQ